MAKFKILRTQVCRATREITTEVEAHDLRDAIAAQEAEEAPAFDDPRWATHWDLLSEHVSEA